MNLLLRDKIKRLLGVVCLCVVGCAGVYAGLRAEGVPGAGGPVPDPGRERIVAVINKQGLVDLFYIRKNGLLYRQSERAGVPAGPGYMHWGPAVRIRREGRWLAAVRVGAMKKEENNKEEKGPFFIDAKDSSLYHDAMLPGGKAEQFGWKANSVCFLQRAGGLGQVFYFDDKDHLFYNREYKKNFWVGEHPVRDDRRSVFTMEPLNREPSYKPAAGWHVNDHCFVKYQGKWHMYGIVAPNPGVKGPEVMNYLGAAVSDCLHCKEWKESPPPFYDPVEKGAVLWAPYVVRARGLFWLFYCAGGDPEQFGIAYRTSSDLVHWSERTVVFREGYQARDPMVFWLESEKKWVLYYASTERNEGGHYVVAYRTSRDLVKWSARKIAYTDLHSGSDYGDVESPFVVKRGGSYYLFTGPRPYDYPTDSLHNHLHPGYVGTDVFRSSRWDHFENAGFVEHLPVHAPEIVEDDGQWYISHGGMEQGGLYITRLKWKTDMK